MVTSRNSYRKTPTLTHSQNGGSLKPSMENFKRLMEDATDGESAIAVSQAQETLESATLTAMHAKTTYDLAKVTFKSARKSAKTAFTHAKENPEPFIAAAIPVAIGVWAVLRRIAKNREATALRGNTHASHH